MIKEVINEINTIIEDSKIINRYGGYCDVDKSKGMPVGISKTKDIKGNTYTFDARVKASGFLEFQKERTNIQQFSTQFYYLNMFFVVHLFVSQKKVARAKNYSTALRLLEIIRDNIHYKLKSFEFKLLESENPDCEYSTITIGIKTPVGCNYVIENNPEPC